MATLTFSYNTGSVPLSRIVDGVAAAHNYQPLIDGQPNPESKADFARRMVAEQVKRWVRGQEEQAALAQITITDITLT